MFAGDVAAGDEIGDGITSSMTILYDLDANQLGTGPENKNSWDWNSNISAASSNNFAGQSNVYYDHQGMNVENGDRSQKIMYQDSLLNDAYPSAYQNNMYDQNGYNQYNYQNYDSSYIDSSKHVGQTQPRDNFVVSSYNTNYSQPVKNASWANTQSTPQQLAKANNNSYPQHGLHQRNILQSFGATSSGANYKILPSKKFVVGNVFAHDYPQLGQRGMLASAFARKSLGVSYQGPPTPLLKNRPGQLGHGLIKIVNDNNTNTNKKPSLVFHDPPYQRQKTSFVQPLSPECAEKDEGRNNGAEKQFSPTAIEVVSVSTDGEESETPSSPQTVVVKTVPVRNVIFGHKKLKFRCVRCGNRDATFNSQLTHVKSHRKPFCMQCCWIGDHALQLKAHVEKAHPKIDTGSGVTMVTSKYGRKCQVNTSVAVGLKRKKLSAKSPQKLASNLADAEDDEKPQKKVPLLLEIKTERVEEVEVLEGRKEVKMERFSPVPKIEQTKSKAQSGTKLPAKVAMPPTRELSKRRLVLMAKNEPKGEEETPPSVLKEEETPQCKRKIVLKEEETPPKRKVDLEEGEIPLSKRKIARKDDRTPHSKGKIDPKENGPPPEKEKISFVDEEKPHSKGKIAPKRDDTPLSKRNIALRVDGKLPPKGTSTPMDDETSPLKGATAPRELREMSKRVLRKK